MKNMNRIIALIVGTACLLVAGGVYFWMRQHRPLAPAPPMKPAVIFIHGTANGTRRGTPELANWFAGVKAYISKKNKLVPVIKLEDGYVAKKLAMKLVEYDPERYTLENAYAFTWNGALSNEERKQAAQKLFGFITEKGITNVECYTHSHGGNVLMHFANLVEQASQEQRGSLVTIEKAVMFACPVQDETVDFLEAACVKKVIPLFSTNDKIQVLDPQKLWSNVAKTFFSRKRFARTLKRKGKLREAEIRIDGQGGHHGSFLREPFLDHLTEIMEFLTNSSDIEHIINIDTEHKKLTRLKEQPITAYA